MRLYTDTAEHYIRALALSIGKDPASLEHWHCAHIALCADEEVLKRHVETTLQSLKRDYAELDYDMVACRDHDILIIGKDFTDDTLFLLEQEMIRRLSAEGINAAVTRYDVFRQWRAIHAVLMSKAPEGVRPSYPQDSADFGETASLSDIFLQERNKRRNRQPAHLLIVDDDPMTRRLVSGLFKEHYAVISAKDANEAVAQYLLRAPDVVFLDINLPDYNGFQVLRHITETDPQAYVVMFSGNSYLDNVVHALNAGASGFVAKPFKKEKMLHYIQDAAIYHQKQMQ